MATIKEKVTGFLKTFGIELALEFYHSDIASKVKELFNQYTAESLAQLIRNSEVFIVPDSFIDSLSEYGDILKEYNTESLTKFMYELLGEVRPDLAKTMDLLGDEAATWFYRCTEAVRDRIANPERYNEEIEKAQTVKVTCDNCHKSMRVFKEDVASMTRCPFCGAGGEKPASSEEPAPEEEEE